MNRLRRTFFLIQQPFESAQLPLHVLVYLKITRHNHFHLAHIVINVTVLRILALNVLNEFSLLCDHMSHFFKVFQMIRSELLLFFHDVINFLVESEQVLVGDCLASA